MARRIWLVGAVCLLGASLVFGDGGARLSGKSIRTWAEGPERVFLVEGNASITTPGGRLAGAAMVVWFDEGAAARSRQIVLRVYSESGGAGTITVVKTAGGLAVDDSGLAAYGRPTGSAIFARATAALRREGREAEKVEAPSPSGTQEGRSPEPQEKPQPTVKAGIGFGKLANIEAEKITWSSVDSNGYDMESEKIGETTQYVVTGGIEASIGRFRMRADNMVVRETPRPEGGQKEIEVYAEGDVRFFAPEATLEAERLLYDSRDDRAVLVEAKVLTQLRPGLPLVVRAEKIRSWAGELYQAENAYVTTCEFGKPHYRLAAKSASVIPVTHEDGTQSALVVAKGNKFYAGEAAILRWPRMARDIADVYTPLRHVGAGNSKRFGRYVYTTWSLYDFVGPADADSWAARASRWSDLTGQLDYRSKRGTGIGLGFEWEKAETKGEVSGYYTRDRGTDADGFKADSQNRGRIEAQQRTFFGDYQMDAELSYISDRGFLREYYKREFQEDKEQESYIYLKRPWEHVQASALYRARLNDYQSQAEYLPQGRLDAVGEPLWDGVIIYDSTTRADNVRWQPDDALGEASYQTQRFDTKHAFEMPMSTARAFTFTPFGTIRESYFEDGVDGRRKDRFAGSWGAKVGLPPVWRVYDVSSGLLNINRLRHVATFDFTYEDVYNSTRTPSELLQFDDVDAVGETKVATLALRQRLETKREGAAEGDPQRTVQFARLDVEGDYFPEATRDNSGRAWSDVRCKASAEITDDLSIVADGDFNTYDGKFDKAGAWLRLDHSPRTVMGLGNRYIRGISSSVVTGKIEHVITERWEIGALAQYDFNKDEMLDEKFILRRNVHEFAVEFVVTFNKGRHDTTVGMNVYQIIGRGAHSFQTDWRR